MQNINVDLINFILDEIKDHTAQLVYISEQQDTDSEMIEYHSEKIRSMVAILKEGLNATSQRLTA